MKRVLIVIAAALALVACNKKSTPEPESTDPAGSAATETSEADSSAGDAAEEEEEEKPPHIDSAVVEKYAVYLQGVLAEHRKIVAEVDKLDKEKAGALESWSKSIAISERYAAAEEKLRKDSGLSEAQIVAMQDLVGSVVLARSLVDAGAVQSISDMRKQIQGLPPEQRAESEKSIAEMEKGIADMRNATEARERWGDAAVDAVIKDEQKLVALWKESAKAAGATVPGEGAEAGK